MGGYPLVVFCSKRLVANKYTTITAHFVNGAIDPLAIGTFHLRLLANVV